MYVCMCVLLFVIVCFLFFRLLSIVFDCFNVWLLLAACRVLPVSCGLLVVSVPLNARYCGGLLVVVCRMCIRLCRSSAAVCFLMLVACAS